MQSVLKVGGTSKEYKILDIIEPKQKTTTHLTELLVEFVPSVKQVGKISSK